MLEYAKIIFLLASCFIILFTLVKQRNKNTGIDYLRFLFYSLLITLFLIFIIEVELHHILRASFNIPNIITYLFYFVIVGSYFLIYRKMLLQYKYGLIIFSLLFFGLANVIDLLDDGKLIVLANNEIVEDALNILGTIFWLLFFINYSTKLKMKQ